MSKKCAALTISIALALSSTACKSTSKKNAASPEGPNFDSAQAVAFDFKGAAAIANKIGNGPTGAMTLDAKGNELKTLQINFGSLVVKASRVKVLGNGDISLVAEQYAVNDWTKIAAIDLPLPSGQNLTDDCGQFLRITPSTKRIRCLLADKTKLFLLRNPAHSEQTTDPLGNVFSTGQTGNILKVASDGSATSILDGGFDSRLERGSSSGLLYYTADLKTGNVALIDEKTHAVRHFSASQYLGLEGKKFIFLDTSTGKIKLFGPGLAETVINPLASTVVKEIGTGISGQDGQTITVLLNKGGLVTIDLTTNTFSVAPGTLTEEVDSGLSIGKAAFLYHSKSGRVYLRRQTVANDILLGDGIYLASPMTKIGDKIMFTSGDGNAPMLNIVDPQIGSLSRVKTSTLLGEIQAFDPASIQ